MGNVCGSNFNVAAGSFNEALSKINARMDRNDLSLVQALLATSDGRDAITPMLATAGNWAKYAAAASTVVGATVTLFGADAVSHFKKVAQEMSKSLKELCDVAAVSTNLAHEEKFPQWVYDFVSDQISIASFGRDLEGSNNEDLMRRIQTLGQAKLGRNNATKKRVAHYYFVYHPATDWHAPFNNKMRENRLPGFVGCTNSIDALGIYLVEFRRIIGPEAIIHILLPSAHMYVIEQDITVIKELQPIKITGQVHRSGNPYVHAAIEGLEEADIRDVGCLIKPNVVGAWDKVGAAAGGVGAGIAGGYVGFWGVGLCAVAVTSAPLVIGAGAIAGLLGGGSAAGALTGIHITEKAKWRRTGTDKKGK
jgi:hypothetical protein